MKVIINSIFECHALIDASSNLSKHLDQRLNLMKLIRFVIQVINPPDLAVSHH